MWIIAAKVSIKPRYDLVDIVRGIPHAAEGGPVSPARDTEQLGGYAGFFERPLHPFRLVKRNDLVFIAVYQEKGRGTG
jgi:hypothetical protein